MKPLAHMGILFLHFGEISICLSIEVEFVYTVLERVNCNFKNLEKIHSQVSFLLLGGGAYTGSNCIVSFLAELGFKPSTSHMQESDVSCLEQSNILHPRANFCLRE